MSDTSYKLALSVAGHDKGILYAVLKKDGSAVFLADGKRRKLSSPKRKNIKHVLFLPDSDSEDSKSGIQYELMTDAALRRALAGERRRRLNKEKAEKDQGGTNIG